jgi:hypothetical protein
LEFSLFLLELLGCVLEMGFQERDFMRLCGGLSLDILDLLIDMSQPSLIEGDDRERCPPVVVLFELLEFYSQQVLLSEDLGDLFERQLSYTDVHLVVLFLERVETVAEDRVDFSGLERFRHLIGLVFRPGDLVSQQVVVELDLTV